MRTSPSPSSTYKVGSGLGMLLLSAAGRSTSCIQNQDPRHSKSLSPLRCHIVTQTRPVRSRSGRIAVLGPCRATLNGVIFCVV